MRTRSVKLSLTLGVHFASSTVGYLWIMFSQQLIIRTLVLEHGSPAYRSRAITNLINGLSQYASHEQSIKSVLKALKEGGPEVLDRVVARLCESPKGYVSNCF